MGLAASQARFLSLTARKSNVEYAGQQINQARTTLANESAGLFHDMLAIKVPVVSEYMDALGNINEAAYDAAKDAYDAQMNIINAGTADIQEQDKNYELQLKQNDSEHNAIQTEMDAV